MTDSTPATAASIPYEGTDCTAEEAVEAVEAVRATAALRDWPCTNADHHGLCGDDHVHADHVVTGIHKDPATGGSA